ncbi:uncharacterized protein BHQ10_008877 [Talaromyces amestolkiae]|uniref:non-specific serine/threonine protein kinase n=1 Tax=Talaromyces amestolkiae TaxID=1196081 RepID=A0A364LAK8_TALAM|nr:uncharacterized protein BHQ10_008877 [Talaromyces amestolkiae]RAO72865.1 hypothetical protein BHQ10_008877 [Talaromyces amestolkiae]
MIYCDLRPENILLDLTGHIALCDFGLCKIDIKDEDRTKFYRTPEYLAPELLLGHEYTKSVDFWTLGILLYEMLTGLPPFYDKEANDMCEKIIQEPLEFPSHEIVPTAARDLLTRLLDRDPQSRLGANGADEIKAHYFFSNIDWCRLLQKEYEPAFKPSMIDVLDTSNFDKKRRRLEDSLVKDKALSQPMQDQFAGWSYNQPVAGFGDTVTYSSFPRTIPE